MTKAVTLLDQTKELIILMERLENPDDLEAINEFNAALIGHSDKIDRCVNYIQHTDMTIEWLKIEKRHIDSQIKKLESGIEKMKARALEVMALTGQKELIGTKGHKFTERLYDSVNVTNLEAVPEEYKSTEVKITADKNKIKNAIKQGIDIPGIEYRLEPSVIVK